MTSLALVACVLLSSTPTGPGELTGVTLRNQDFEVVKVISDQAALQAFERSWKAKTTSTPPATPRWTYKLDLAGKGARARWLYDPAGYVQVLTEAKSPIYAIPNPEAFRELVGAKAQVAPEGPKPLAP